MRAKSAVLALLLISLTKPATAEHIDVETKTLYGWCRPYEVGSSENIGSLCEGYINAIADILAHGVPIHDNRACIPEHVQLADLRDLVIEALKDGPKTSSKAAHDWTARAISQAFPCRHSNNR
jgi:hypothetical protein